jgi:hypothetical protein
MGQSLCRVGCQDECRGGIDHVLMPTQLILQFMVKESPAINSAGQRR